MRLVLDTSVLISALRSPTGASGALLDAIFAGELILLMNLPIAYEYRVVALRPEHVAESVLSFQEIERLLDRLSGLAEAVENHFRYRPLSVDPNDDLILELAINGAADTIVTNNIRHLRPAGLRFGIDVVDARTLLLTLNGA